MSKASKSGGLFTSCASCLQQFRIRASQLAVANGQVRCGACGHQFNALRRLSDKPVSPQVPESKQDKDGTFTIDLHGPDYPQNYPPDQEYMVLEEFWMGKPQPDRPWINWFWNLSALILVFLVFGQLAWFNRDPLFTHYPVLLDPARAVCDHYDCQLFRYRNVSAIRLLKHDVRTHPLDRDSLLVNGILVNTLATGQPYPRIQLALLSRDGRISGFREFSVQEYLHDSVDPYAIMPPSVPVHFILELAGTNEHDINFEFHFL